MSAECLALPWADANLGEVVASVDKTEVKVRNLLKYRALHDKISPGRPIEINYQDVFEQAREIERALKIAGVRVIRQLQTAASAEDVAAVFHRIPASKLMPLPKCRLRSKGWDEPIRSVLLGGWDVRGKIIPWAIAPDEQGNPATFLWRAVKARSLPELIYEALQCPEQPQKEYSLIRFIAESVAAPSIFDSGDGLDRRSLEYSRRICRNWRSKEHDGNGSK